MANFCAFGQIFLFQRAKYWTSDLVIWSHCTNRKRLQEELYFGISLFTDRLTVLYLPMMMTMSLSWWLWPTKAVVILIIGTYSIFCKYFVYPTATIQNGSAVLNHFICYLLIYPPPLQLKVLCLWRRTVLSSSFQIDCLFLVCTNTVVPTMLTTNQCDFSIWIWTHVLLDSSHLLCSILQMLDVQLKIMVLKWYWSQISNSWYK